MATKIREATALLNATLQEKEICCDDRSESGLESEKADDFEERTTAIKDAIDAWDALGVA